MEGRLRNPHGADGGISGQRPSIVCIDTWLGTIESYVWRRTQPNLHTDLRLQSGWPHLYYQFLANVVRAGFAEKMVPCPRLRRSGCASSRS